MPQVHAALLRQSEEELKEARREAARTSSEVGVQRGEARRLLGELQKTEEELRGAIRCEQSLNSHFGLLSQELEELRGKHQVTGSISTGGKLLQNCTQVDGKQIFS